MQMCMQVSLKARRGHRGSPGAGILDAVSLLIWVLGTELGPLEEQPELFAEPSL